MAELRSIINQKKDNDNKKLMISIEPLLDFNLGPFLDIIKPIEPDYISIGADSKKNKLNESSNKDKVLELLTNLKLIISDVRGKDNFNRMIS